MQLAVTRNSEEDGRRDSTVTYHENAPSLQTMNFILLYQSTNDGGWFGWDRR